jgi:D-alanine-D-alanine ligase
VTIAIIHQHPAEDASAAEHDVMVQRDAVAHALESLGHEVIAIASTLDLAGLRRRLAVHRPSLVFNLVESLGETDRLMVLVPLLLDALGVPYTGAPAAGLAATTDKLGAKRRMLEAGVPTPPWWELGADDRLRAFGAVPSPLRAGPVIVKAIWEHASFGMDDDAVSHPRRLAELRERIEARTHDTGTVHFAERYIDGREFNVALLDHGDGGPPEVLPVAEIRFDAFPPGKPHIVGQAAKWDEGSFEYEHTPRRFEVDPHDEALVARMMELATTCWGVFGLRGYARVDFRVDRHGAPWVLEVNANPCLSPDAGYAAALERARIPFAAAVERIVRAAVPATLPVASPRTRDEAARGFSPLAPGCVVVDDAAELRA